MSFFSVNHKKPLFKNGLFWIFTLSPLIAGTLLGLSVWVDYCLSFTPESYSNFLNISKLPLGVMSLTFPISGVFIVHYTSKQKSENLFILEVDKLDSYINKSDEIRSLLKSLKKIEHNISAYCRHINKVDRTNLYQRLHDHIYKPWNSTYNEVVRLSHLHDIKGFEEIDGSLWAFINGAGRVDDNEFYSEMVRLTKHDFRLIEYQLLARWHLYQMNYIDRKNDLCKLYGLFDKIDNKEYSSHQLKYESYINDYNNEK
ncbi:hypothetical protein [Vibrio metschnikovii]|uniref:hypothetical protein n=1 Tax=Vibrio metschnikovii TaxID=28172 RepID=UPI001C3001F4|nr:hypothetical protein [Vibrio metschnikovii]